MIQPSDVDNLVEAAIHALDALSDLIFVTSDPGSNAFGAQYMLRQALGKFGVPEGIPPTLRTEQDVRDSLRKHLIDRGYTEEEKYDIVEIIAELDVDELVDLIVQHLKRTGSLDLFSTKPVVLDRQIVEVLTYVSGGRGRVNMATYPHVTAQAAMGRIEVHEDGSGTVVTPYVKPEDR